MGKIILFSALHNNSVIQRLNYSYIPATLYPSPVKIIKIILAFFNLIL